MDYGDQMRNRLYVSLGNFLLSISDAMDLVSPLLCQHQQRVAFVAWEISRAGALSDDLTETIFIAALLHDIGALSLEERLSLHDFEEKNTALHCARGENLLQSVPWVENAAPIIRYHHRGWDEWDEPIDTPVAMASQIIFLADYLERLIDRNRYVLHQDQEILSRISSLSATLFHPQIVDYLLSTARREEFWLDLISPRLYSVLLHEGPYRRLEIDLPSLSSLAKLIKNIIDFRSRFTATHSSGVAACAVMLSKIFGLTDTEVQLMEIAGDLHDLGKLAVPNSILDKPDKLTKQEFEIIKSHTYFTYSVLSTVKGLEQVAEWSAYHHEKLDGSGYPFHCKAEELDTGARILMVADLFTAITEDRPYRKGMSKEKAIRIIKDFADQQLMDRRIVDLLIENYAEVHSFVGEKQAEALQFYEKQFAPLERAFL